MSLSIKSDVPKALRPRIWMWLGQLERYEVYEPYTLYSELKSTQSRYDGLIRKDVLRSLQYIKYFKTKKLKKQQQQALQQLLESQKSLNEISDEQLLAGMTEGQKKLFYVLRAYANYDDAVGYAQGMNYLGAILLYYLDSAHYKDKQYSFGDKTYCELD